ncbi:MAG TPA: archease [Candidatus Limnocylindria bacterium]|nr:archease [Candidatus Limnocylindria bacterium]
MGSVRQLEEIAIADCAWEIDAADLPDLFETAVRALAELTVDPATLAGTVEARIELRADSLDLLLFDFLSELIYRRDTDGVVFHGGRVAIDGDGPYRLDARLTGGRIDMASTMRSNDPKAVTLHQLAVEPHEGGWRARVVLDI